MLKQVSASGAIVSKGGFPDPAGAQWQLNSLLLQFLILFLKFVLDFSLTISFG